MTLEAFIFAKGRKATQKRHLAVWIGGYLLLTLTYPPRGGPISGLDVEGLARYYKMVGIRGFFHLLCQMLLCYPLLYYLIPQFLDRKSVV